MQKGYWDKIWREKSPEDVSWFESEPSASLELLGAAATAKGAHIVDVGGGASTLVEHLLARGFKDITIVDLSEHALRRTKERLGPRASEVRWLSQDARSLELPEPADFWHDRAAFHFLTSTSDQDAYLRSLRRGLRAGGHAMIATFALSGPQSCSGLPVVRYSVASLGERLGRAFELVRAIERTHETPAGRTQPFTYGLFRVM